MATKKPTTKNNVTVAEEVPQQQNTSAIEAKLDRIIELLEGTLMIKEKGLDLTSPWWNRFLDK